VAFITTFRAEEGQRVAHANQSYCQAKSAHRCVQLSVIFPVCYVCKSQHVRAKNLSLPCVCESFPGQRFFLSLFWPCHATCYHCCVSKSQWRSKTFAKQSHCQRKHLCGSWISMAWPGMVSSKYIKSIKNHSIRSLGLVQKRTTGLFVCVQSTVIKFFELLPSPFPLFAGLGRLQRFTQAT